MTKGKCKNRYKILEMQTDYIWLMGGTNLLLIVFKGKYLKPPGHPYTTVQRTIAEQVVSPKLVIYKAVIENNTKL